MISWEEAVRRLKADPANAELVRACYYDDPLTDAAARFYASGEWKAVRRRIGRGGGRALDIGAGRGISSYALARDGWQVDAIEPDPSGEVGRGAIEALARAAGLSIQIHGSYGETLPFDDGSFDLVYLRQSLHHARDLAGFCAEASRVLKRGGRFIATREHVLQRDEDLQTFLESHPLHSQYGGENAYTLDTYRAAFEAAGLVLESVIEPYSSIINLAPTDPRSLFSGFDIFGIRRRRRIARLNRTGLYPGILYTFVCHRD